MDPAFPLTQLTIRAGSVAQDLAFVALHDAARLFFETLDPAGILIGGQMVTLHAYRWGLGAELYRESLDADMGLPLIALKDPTLLDRIVGLGYERTSGNTFQKRVNDVDAGTGEPRYAVLELLAPAFTSRARASVSAGDFTVTEVAGLAIALRASIAAGLTLIRSEGQRTTTRIMLPDETGCLILRAHAWKTRFEDRDAIDVWRALEIASQAGVTPDRFAAGLTTGAAEIVRTDFGTIDAPGVQAALAGRNLTPKAPLAPRIVALTREVVGV